MAHQDSLSPFDLDNDLFIRRCGTDVAMKAFQGIKTLPAAGLVGDLKTLPGHL